MKRFTRKRRSRVWAWVVLSMILAGFAGCHSSNTMTEPAVGSEEPSPVARTAPVEEASPQAADDQGASRKPERASASQGSNALRPDPFSEDRIEALEASLRPLEAIPTKTQATVAHGG